MTGPRAAVKGPDLAPRHDEAVLQASTSTISADADEAPLEIAKDVRLHDGALSATSGEPWLRFRSIEAFRPGRLVEIRYASSPFDSPVRPLLRFWRGGGEFRDEILPAPCEGVGIWVGRVPKERSEVWLSPTNRPGRFDFRLIDVRPASFLSVARRAARVPKRLFFAVCAGWVGLSRESELNWRWALGGEALSTYPAWRAARRNHAITGLDLPRSDWRVGPTVSLLLDLHGATGAEIDESCRAVAGQSYPNWRVLFIGSPQDAGAQARLAAWEREGGFARFAPDKIRFESGELIGRLSAGDRPEPNAFACFVEHFARHPEQLLAYSDATRGEGAGLRPVFKPPWSPTLHRSVNYIGRAALFRASLVASDADWTAAAPEDLIAGLAARASASEVGALHRPLFALARETNLRCEDVPAVYRENASSVVIVIPTRDRPDLLGACLESVFRETSYSNYRVVVVDNESVEPRTHALFERLQAAHDRLTILKSPGAFNFSALCNAGAQAIAGDHLLFLNNDTEVLTPDWIERLLHFAAKPEVGAVGAKLLYPNRLTQHVGVLLGMGGVAGHFGAELGATDPGWTRRNLVPHEVSAVTGACLMVERRKFDAVGGFDAVNLPVELNDVDLCLRLAERGWRTICNSQVVLIHHQSASRGGGLRLQRVYEKERSYFCDRWRSAIRDDPYFHPGLSLYAHDETLP